MFQFFLFTLFLILSPTSGLIKTLFQTENHCYSGCHANYRDSWANAAACKDGCNFKLQNENCADQCRLLSIDEQIQASCVVGCSMSEPKHEKAIVFIRLRERPLFQLPFMKNDPVKAYNEMIKELKDQSKTIEQSHDLKPIAKLVKSIPLIQSFDEVKDHQFKQILLREDDRNDHLQQLVQFIHKQSKLSGWILLGLLIFSSAILFCMIISLCRTKFRHNDLSIRSEELILEKELLQSDAPVKITLTNH